MKNFLFENRLYFIVFFILTILFVIFDNSYSIYDKPVAKITAVTENELFRKYGTLSGEEIYYEQKIEAEILSGSEKGQKIVLSNRYASSLVYDEKYRTGQRIFLTEPHNETYEHYRISGIKRDSSIMLSFLLLVLCLLAVGKKQGLATTLCLLANIGILTLLLMLHKTGLPLLPLSIGASLLFSFIIVFLINGININSVLVSVVTIASISCISLLSAAVLYSGSPLEYEFLEYLPKPFEHSEANLIFLSEILMAGTGVIIDIAMTIVSFAVELISKKPEISTKALMKSCFVVSENITGTMINVVFFTNVAGSIPLFIISLANGVSLLTLLRYNIYFEACRFFTAGIGLLLTIPFSAVVALIYSKRRVKPC